MPSPHEILLSQTISTADQLEAELREEKAELLRLFVCGHMQKDDDKRLGKSLKLTLLRMTIHEMEVEDIQGGIIPGWREKERREQ